MEHLREPSRAHDFANIGELSKWDAMGEIIRTLLIGLMLMVGGGIVRAELRDDGIANGATNMATPLRALTARVISVDIERAREVPKRCKKSNYRQCDELEGNQTRSSATSVSMQREGDGVYVVPVLINNAVTLNLVLDSGASDVRIPADVVKTLMRTGALKQADFQGKKTYTLADGSTVPSRTFRIRSLKVGGKVVENVNGSVASLGSGLLLGQSFLGRLKSWSVDNTKNALVLE